MANFDQYQSKSEAARRAFNVLPLIRGIYAEAKQVQAALALYQSGSDVVFNAAVNAIFSAAERSELLILLTQLNALVTDWEANHSMAIGRQGE
jgi:hypothetical protein